MVSMKDISQRCGVSVATVSKALNDQSDIGEETKKHIKEVARQMGYFPNASAKQLKTNRSNNIGVLMIDEAGMGLTHDFYGNILENIRATAEEKGYDITFINCNEQATKMSFLEHSRYRGLDGVAVVCAGYNDPEVVELVNSDLPVVTVDHVFNGVSAVISDNVKGMRELIEFIYREKGHRDIAFIHGTDSAVTRNRLASFYRTMEELGGKVPDEYVCEGAYRDTAGSHDHTLRLLKMKNPPTCIIYPDDFALLGGLNAIQELGLSVPEDISIAGYDGINISQVLEPKITTIKQDTALMWKKTAERLINLIERPKTTIIERVVVDGKLLKGGSVRSLED